MKILKCVLMLLFHFTLALVNYLYKYSINTVNINGLNGGGGGNTVLSI